MKRHIKTSILTDTPYKKLPVNGPCEHSGAIVDGNLKPLKMTAKQALAMKVKQFKNDSTLKNFNAEITVLLSNCKTYWALSVAVTTLIK